ncbi:lipoprotein [Deinococcus rubellus]|uniref:Uncharacterized protein n=1 Tax=Deinococcus rubellus TaxID=1889240 RepID=A0ABY5YF46_9DEIO|nr:hypothetical protein [Deinococcus rubellus]UWX63566.1 hypothetical protein N0D28_12580 [Deinococcus rubellus]
MFKFNPFKHVFISAALVGSFAFAQTPTASPTSQMAPEVHPVGDIPDNQAFVPYHNTVGNYTVDAPEGWARTVNGSDVSFLSKLGEVKVTVTPSKAAPSVSSVRADTLKALASTESGVKINMVKALKLPAGPAILASFDSLSAPNAVTGKAALLENDLYVLNHAGQQVQLRFSAPKGSDNVDAWRQMSRSLRWK